MTTMTKLACGLGAFALAVLAAKVADAQSPASAATVLGNVQQYYAKAQQLTAVFRQTVTNATFNTSKTSDGQLWVLKPDEFRWDYTAKRNGGVVVIKTFVFDGTTLWLVDHQNKQIVQNQVQSSVLPAAVSFLTGGSALSSQFSVAIDASGKYGGREAIVLELTPNQPSAQYQQLFFVVDPSNWHVKESIVIDSSGDTNTFSFYTPKWKAAVKASLFQVNPSGWPTYKLVQIKQTGAGSGVASPTTSP